MRDVFPRRAVYSGREDISTEGLSRTADLQGSAVGIDRELSIDGLDPGQQLEGPHRLGRPDGGREPTGRKQAQTGHKDRGCKATPGVYNSAGHGESLPHAVAYFRRLQPLLHSAPT